VQKPLHLSFVVAVSLGVGIFSQGPSTPIDRWDTLLCGLGVLINSQQK
jgi:hypothetical protein